MKRLFLLCLAFATTGYAQDDVTKKIDAIFAAYAKPDTPGCAVGVARGGKPVVERAYGMANLEYDVPLTPSTIFEAGSVSKQFTAAAVLLLAEDGKLSLDDRVRKYIPELPDSAANITIRQMLNHTSGLRDWGSVVDLAGWRRGTRRFSHPWVLDVLSRQRALNFPAGTQWSYSNSNYNLAAIVVERVSGKSFPEFTRERIFTPLGMTHSSWRDDYTRVVKGRATAYDPDDHGYVSDMDFENIYGNCCLLTTVGDLLRWNENFRTATVGGAKMIAAMQTPGTLASGQKIDYAFGLFVTEENGRTEVYHSGATAGWRAFLTRRIDDDLSIAVLCNRGDASTASFIEKVANAFVERTPPPRPKGERDDALAGLYRDAATDAILRVTSKDDGLHLGLSRSGNGPALSPLGGNRFKLGRFNEVRFESDGLHLITLHKAPALYARVAEADPKQLAEYTGKYTSDEVGVTYTASVDAGALAIRVSPVSTMKLEPTYADGFVTDDGDLIHFTRNAKGKIDGFDFKADYAYTDGSARVERMHFNKR